MMGISSEASTALEPAHAPVDEDQLRSKRRSRRLFWTLVGVGLLIWAVLINLFGDPYLKVLTRQGRLFNIPSDGMAPTLVTGDRFFARFIDPADVKRGDVLIIRVDMAGGEVFYVKRVAALPNETIELKDGVVSINGSRIPQKFEKMEEVMQESGPIQAKRMLEQFPGEAAPHYIFDMAVEGFGDFYGPVKVPAGHIFLLGDNRDNSADSRFDRTEKGIGFLPLSRVVGRAETIFASNAPERKGRIVR
jgi:signal peptidase I